MAELVIEDAEACQLAAELVELTGDSLRMAVMTALREERDRALVRRRRHERIMAITREIARGSSGGLAVPRALRFARQRIRDFRRRLTSSTLAVRVLPRLDMGAQLNIKSEDAYRLASRLAELTGESLTSVVTKALQAELERQERQRDRQERLGACWRCGRYPRTICEPVRPKQAGCMTKTDCRSDRR